ncbi:dTDP-rhamnosyl transferase [Pectobacterium actinidiae]|uniref:dTDP-rhamnosyl transferase n=2 Tax=Pectobacterium actinidiae TaxID=1507808 RepID=A0A1V2R865_9GAMM|nr:dTDP-rhamnosyl transferase [Pectobacterium actinidiae]ONK08649.1 dTDP-rhamnosyl transferase [Pectobacterium actinidiae]
MNKDRIYAVLVLYNPENEVLDDLLINFLYCSDFFVVCNNSNNGYVASSNFDNVHVINLGENLGIAAAQNIGMKWAFEDGADFVLQLDQDSIPDSNMSDELKLCYYEMKDHGYKIGLIGAQDYDKYTKKINVPRVNKGVPLLKENYLDVSCAISSGSLIPKNVYLDVGGMDSGLFIDAVDYEYCWRLKNHGYKVIKNKKALIAHRLGEGRHQLFPIDIAAPVRSYYITRNIFLLIRRSYVPLFWKISSMIKLPIRLFIYPIILSQGVKRFFFTVKGIKDGFLGKTGIVK